MEVDSPAIHAAARPNPVRCWIEMLIVVVVIPTGIWSIDRIFSAFVPAATHGSVEQRYLLWASHGVIVEWALVAVAWLVLRGRGSSFRDLGACRLGTWPAWLLALALAALSIGSNLRILRFMRVPIISAFLPSGFHLAAALMMGITAGFCEEILFRGFLMTEFARAGYGKVVQILIPGVAFGLAHAGYLNQGFAAWLGIAVPTAFLGMLWGVAYLLGRRSLVPVVVAHFLNDATALPWILFFMIARG